jgi:hypothetical protein
MNKYFLDKKELGTPFPPLAFSRNPWEQKVVYPFLGLFKWPSFIW